MFNLWRWVRRDVFGAIEPGRSRWLRLRPADGGDLVLCALMAVGLVLYGIGQVSGRPDAPWPWAQPVTDAVFMVHGSTPLLFFIAAMAYLMRWGRVIGRNKVWVIAGLVLTIPLWFLVGLPLNVRGFGDATMITIGWNLLALAVMVPGVWRTLHTPGPSENAVET